MDLGQVHAKNPVQRLARGEAQGIGLLRSMPGRGKRRRWWRTRCLQFRQDRLNPLVAGINLGQVGVIQLHGLRQSEDVFLPVIANQCLSDRLGRLLAALVSQRRQRHRVAFASHDRHG